MKKLLTTIAYMILALVVLALFAALFTERVKAAHGATDATGHTVRIHNTTGYVDIYRGCRIASVYLLPRAQEFAFACPSPPERLTATLPMADDAADDSTRRVWLSYRITSPGVEPLENRDCRLVRHVENMPVQPMTEVDCR